MAFSPGENVGPYRVIGQLGQGGMATVFKAYHPALDRYVAMKVLHPAFKEDPHFLARFQREARVVAKLEHPHIVPIYDFSQHEGHPYLVMKYIEGETLKSRLSAGPLTVDEAITIIDAVGSALTYAHGRGVLHRDIKPSNILLSPDGSIYLADFGLARIAEAGASTLSQDMMLGTPQYISPEQAKGSGKLDAGTDIYSLGVVMYEIVVGRVPFNADTPFSIIHDHIYTPLPIPRAVNPRVPEPVETVLLRSLAKSRADRFTSVDQQIRAFDVAVRKGEPGFLAEAEKTTVVQDAGGVQQPIPVAGGSAGEPDAGGSPEKRGKPGRRRWLWAGLGAVLAFFCLLAFLAVLARSGEDQASAPDAVPMAVSGEELPAEVSGLEGLEGTPSTHIRRAEAFLESGRQARALTEFIKAAKIYLDEGQYLEAVKVYERALEVTEIPLETNRTLSESLIQALFLGAPDPVMWPKIDRFVELHPGWSPLNAVHAREYLYQGRLDESVALLDRTLAESPQDPLALAVQVEYLIEVGAVDEAQAILQAAGDAAGRLPPWIVEHFEWLTSRL
jgi:tetratricopeptide (TPR) repeat protein